MTHPSVAAKLDAVSCCHPRPLPVGSGWHLYHSHACGLHPGRKVKDTHPELFKGPLPPSEPHAACRLSYVDGGTACWRCSPLLHDAGCECDRNEGSGIRRNAVASPSPLSTGGVITLPFKHFGVMNVIAAMLIAQGD